MFTVASRSAAYATTIDSLGRPASSKSGIGSRWIGRPVVPPSDRPSESVRMISKRSFPSSSAIERAGVRLCDGLRREDDRLEQPVDVLLAGERDADPVQLLGTVEEVEGCAIDPSSSAP